VELDKVLKELHKRYGQDVVFSLDSEEDLKRPNVYSTNSLILDWNVLGTGGIPRGRVTEIAGIEGSGKTTVSLHTTANAQKSGDKVAYIDAENKLDLRYAAALGVDVTSLLISQPDNGEIALDVADALCKVEEVGLIVFDSAAALGGQDEEDKDFDENASVAKIPRVINKFFRRNMSNIRKNDIAVIFTNQMRDVISSPIAGLKNTTGGHGLQHYSSVLLRLARTGDIKRGDGTIAGHVVKAVAKKNNVDKPKRTGLFKLWYGTGIDIASEVIEFGVEAGIVVKRGSFYNYKDQRLAQGLENAKNYLNNENPELLETLREECQEWLKENLA